MNAIEEIYIADICKEADRHRHNKHDIKQFGQREKESDRFKIWFKCDCGWARHFFRTESAEEKIAKLIYKLHVYKPLLTNGDNS